MGFILLLLGAGVFWVIALKAPLPWSVAALGVSSMAGWLGSVRLFNQYASLFSRPLEKTVHWAHAMSFETVLFCATIFLRPLGHFLFHKKSSGAKQGKPILLIHGYCHDCSVWSYLRWKLVKEGFGPIYVLNLKSPFRSIRSYAEKVSQKAEQIERETGKRDLILIGHSMGGLVCSWYASKLAPHGKVSDVITIASPLEGTRIACIGVGPNAREMEYHSEFTKELMQGIKDQSAIRFYQIGTKVDQLVIPSSSAFLGDHPERQFAVEDLGHLSLLFSPRVAKKVSEWVRSTEVLS